MPEQRMIDLVDSAARVAKEFVLLRQPVQMHPERLPQPVIDAARTLDKAWRSYEVPGLSLSDVPRLYLVLQLDHAYLALCQVHNAHRDEMEALHKEECPGCPWDYESQQMVFPPKGVCS